MVRARGDPEDETGCHGCRGPLRCHYPVQESTGGWSRAVNLDQAGSPPLRFSNLIEELVSHRARIPQLGFRALVTRCRQIRHALRVKEGILAINLVTHGTVPQVILELEPFTIRQSMCLS
jgi:hypothetical protein